VGAGKLGELFVKATPKRLEALAEAIASGETTQLLKEISCIEAIEPVTATYRRNGLSAQEVLEQCPREGSNFVAKVKLFRFDDDADQQSLIENFEKTCTNANLRPNQDGYSASSSTFSVQVQDVAAIDLLSSAVGVRSIEGMPTIQTVRPRKMSRLPLPNLPTREDFVGEVPVVVVVDSGVASTIPDLESWVVGRESSVAPQYRNSAHGSFVAGLICWGHQLNPTVGGIDAEPCAVYDLQVLPNQDPARGNIDSLKEQEFLIVLEDAVRRLAKDFKVWNLSLGTNTLCSLDKFSSLAEELDNLQEEHEITFVISAGNYTMPPLLDFPRSVSQIDAGRITVPADSVLGVTVGSISHVDYGHHGPSTHEPAAYSRHGAGPNHVIKPDLVHYGGACSTDATHKTGIRSVGENGLAENLGTSFAAPLVSKTLAQIYHQISPTPSPVLARALLIHHARDPRTETRVADGEEDFFGFGLPAITPKSLDCSSGMSTLVFDDVLRPGYYLEWDDFPYPPSLTRNGRFFGEVWMTVAFAPMRGSRWGSEYCETHIDATFGVYYKRKSRSSGDISIEYRGLVPPEHKNSGVLYESFQVSKLRKWAPVRTYHGDLGSNGERGDRWRLKVQLLTRHGVEARGETPQPQPFSLILTIADPRGRAPVYDEMARSIQSRFQTQNLALRTSARIRSSLQE
jgi:hypothetical protein